MYSLPPANMAVTVRGVFDAARERSAVVVVAPIDDITAIHLLG